MKTCKIYYATVIEAEETWAIKGEKCVEPVRVEGRQPLGKEPEFCCEDLKAATKSWNLSIGDEHISIAGYFPKFNFDFCPFCGAKIVYISDLKLKTIKYTQFHDSYYFEEA